MLKKYINWSNSSDIPSHTLWRQTLTLSFSFIRNHTRIQWVKAAINLLHKLRDAWYIASPVIIFCLHLRDPHMWLPGRDRFHPQPLLLWGSTRVSVLKSLNNGGLQFWRKMHKVMSLYIYFHEFINFLNYAYKSKWYAHVLKCPATKKIFWDNFHIILIQVSLIFKIGIAGKKKYLFIEI